MNKKLLAALVIIVIIAGGIAWYTYGRSNTTNSSNAPTTPAATTTANQSTTSVTTASMPTATIVTSKGTITVELFKNDAPNTVANFVKLAQKGFYNGVIFHRVIKGFMIQGGDPTGTGRGGPGYKFADELNANTDSYKSGYTRGTVAMANSGPDTNGSQFFIMHKDTPLPHNYTIFGRVTSGMDVVDAIAASKTDATDRPTESIAMTKVTVQE